MCVRFRPQENPGAELGAEKRVPKGYLIQAKQPCCPLGILRRHPRGNKDASAGPREVRQKLALPDIQKWFRRKHADRPWAPSSDPPGGAVGVDYEAARLSAANYFLLGVRGKFNPQFSDDRWLGGFRGGFDEDSWPSLLARTNNT